MHHLPVFPPVIPASKLSVMLGEGILVISAIGNYSNKPFLCGLMLLLWGCTGFARWERDLFLSLFFCLMPIQFNPL